MVVIRRLGVFVQGKDVTTVRYDDGVFHCYLKRRLRCVRPPSLSHPLNSLWTQLPFKFLVGMLKPHSRREMRSNTCADRAVRILKCPAAAV
jgi:hypothetical protein